MNATVHSTIDQPGSDVEIATIHTTTLRTRIAASKAEGRRREIARLLSGAEITPEAEAQAGRLLEV